MQIHSKDKKYLQAPFLVLQLVTNSVLVSVPGGTNQSQQGYWGPKGNEYSYFGSSR